MENDNFRKELFSFVTKYCPKNDHRMKHDDKIISIPNLELIAPFAIYDCHRNITDLCIALFKAIDSDDTSHLLSIKTRPSMPLAEEAEKISSENPTIEDIKRWVDSL